MCYPSRVQNRLPCFQCWKSCYLRGWQVFVAVAWLNATSNSRAQKWLQSTVCEFFFCWVGRDFSFHTSFTTCCSDSTKSLRRLKTVNGKEKLPFSLGHFFPLFLALHFGSTLYLPLLETLAKSRECLWQRYLGAIFAVLLVKCGYRKRLERQQARMAFSP